MGCVSSRVADNNLGGAASKEKKKKVGSADSKERKKKVGSAGSTESKKKGGSSAPPAQVGSSAPPALININLYEGTSRRIDIRGPVRAAIKITVHGGNHTINFC